MNDIPKLGGHHHVNHRLLLISGCTALALVACGSSSSASTSSSSTASPSAAAGARNGGGVFGELVQVKGSTLILNSQTGDVNVAVTSTTTASKTEAGVLGDLTTGQCVTATGPRGATSAPSSTPGATSALPATVSATAVSVAAPVNGQCQVPGARPGGPGGSGSAGANPPPSRSFTPPSGTGGFGGANLVFATGQITAVKGAVLTVHSTRGDQEVTVANGATITKLTPETIADLSVGDCITAAGQRDAGGTVQARTLTVSQPTATGCVPSGRGGFGFGGRGANGAGGAGTGNGAGAAGNGAGNGG